ncbi:hypothetical protein GCM10009836_49510 [Pseudonocardia ailaonensis]|uniref:Uncharacterized protein n=1 Tax=Pseudonocardia ailaonensis TaxID=367279 RepID=A0ABN2NDV3_9PSEU
MRHNGREPEQGSDGEPEGSPSGPTGFSTDADVLALLGHDGAALPADFRLESW